MSKSVLVTGAAGFIGRHVCRALIDAGHRVVGLDINCARDDIPGADWFWADLFDTQPLISAAADCTMVIHLAAHANVRWCEQNASKACRLNIGGCRRLAYGLLHVGVNRIIYANSCAAREPMSVYGYTKRAGLLELQQGAQEFAGEVMSLRLANVYGHGEQDDKRVVPSLIRACKAGEIPTLSFGGHLERDFVHVSDVADAFVRAVELPNGEPYAELEIGIGTGRRTMLRDVCWHIGREFGRDLVQFTPGPESDYEPKSAGEEPGFALQLLGWKPKVRLEDGLKELCREAALT